MNSVFSEQILADKLSKLNSTQQCIETLSHWCIFHRSKAELVVQTWNKQFQNSEIVQRVPLLYLANDILQNSKRKGNEFVTEFWKVLPAALKDVIEKGDDHGKNVVSRLVDIWEQRRVFGSRARNLKGVMLGEEAPPPLELNKKRSRSVKIMKRDSRHIRTKLSIGGAAEKIVSAFHLVLSEQMSEDAEMKKCKSAVQRVRKMEKDVDTACSTAKDPKRKTLAKGLEEEENLLRQCIEKLKLVEASRVALVSQLKEALHEQESELENIRTQVQVAEAQVGEVSNMRKRLDDDNFVQKASTLATDANTKSDASDKKSAAAIAAEVADKLAASSSSQLIMTSVLSTFAAEEAKNAGLASASSPNPDKSTPASDSNVYRSTQQMIPTPSHSFPSVMVAQPTMQNQVPASQGQYHLLGNPTSQQYMQSTAVIPGYGYGNVAPLPPGPPPPPPPSHMVGPVMPMAHKTLQISQHQPAPINQHQPAPINRHQPITMSQQAPVPPSFRPLQPPGMVYYGNHHHSL